jgi:putative glycerol-1-phosphate prenyltransferase
MRSAIYQSVFMSDKKVIALLIDPEKHTPSSLKDTLNAASEAAVDIILAGGSLTSAPIDEFILTIKSQTRIPVILFPGNIFQLSSHADGILLLSLISGRNADYLIGSHVMASQFLKKSGLEIIPTGYMLIGRNNHTSVAYMSNTLPIPVSKTDIIVSTALAGEQLGLKLIYLEAGSGADDRVGEEAVSAVKKELSVPLWVGGGIKSADEIRKLYQAGANGVVIGTAVEEDIRILHTLAAVRKEF